MQDSESSTLLSRPQAAEYLGIKPQTLASWACTGRYGLAYIKVGSRVKYRRSALDEFIERRTVVHSGQLSA